MRVKNILGRPFVSFGIILGAVAAVLLVAVSAATDAKISQKETNQKASSFLASISTFSPTYALNPTPAQQADATNVVHVSGNLTSNQTWSPSNGMYVIDSWVRVPAGITLTINAGTVIKVTDNGSGVMVEEGTLRVNGTSANPVIFTSYRDDSVGGDTNQDGPSFGSWNDYGQAINTWGNATVKFAIMRYGAQSINASCSQTIGSLLATDNVMQGQFSLYQCPLGATTLARNQLGVPVMSAMNLYRSEVSRIELSGAGANTFLLPDQGRAVELDESYVSQAATWKIAAGPVAVAKHFYVHGGLTLQLGATVKVGPNETGIVVESTGNFYAAGTDTAYVTVTSAKDDSVGGDTNGDGESYGSSGDYSAGVQGGGTTKFVRTKFSHGSYSAVISCFGGHTASFIANLNDIRSPLYVDNCNLGKAQIDRNTFTVPSGYAFELYRTDVTNVPLLGANRNYFNGTGQGKVVYLNQSYLPADTNWSFATGQVVVASQFQVDGTVNVGAGSVIKAAPNSPAFNVGEEGSLLVNGTGTARATFTSLQDDVYGGDSGGDGPTSGGSQNYTEAITGAGVIDLKFANIRNLHSAMNVYCPNGLSYLNIEDSILKNTVNFNQCGAGKVTLKRNTFAVERGQAVYASNSEVSGVILSGADRNTFSGTAHARAVSAQNAYVDEGLEWELTNTGGARPVVYNLTANGTIRVLAKTTVKVPYNGTGISVGHQGNLEVMGTASENVTFTSILDDSIDGDTGGDGQTVASPNDGGVAISLGKSLHVQHATFKNTQTAINGNCISNVVTTYRVQDSRFYNPVGVNSCGDDDTIDLKRNRFLVSGNQAPLSVYGSEISGITMSGPDSNTFGGTGIRKTLWLSNSYIGEGRTWEMSHEPGAVLASSNTYVPGTMRLHPGVIVKTPINHVGMHVEYGGTLESIGSVVSPVIFTSIKDDSVDGDTGGDGATTGSAKDAVAIRSYGNTTVRHSSFRNMDPAVDTSCSYSYPDTSLEMTDNDMRSNIRIGGCGSESVNLARNHFNVAVGPAISTYNLELSGIAMTGTDRNTFTGGGQKQSIQLINSMVNAGKTWNVDGSSGAVLTTNAIYVDGALNLEPGLVLKANNSSYAVYVSNNGTLNVDGTSGSPVTVTSVKDDSIGGDSGGDGPTTGALRDSGGIMAYGTVQIQHMLIKNNFPAAQVNCNTNPNTVDFDMVDSQINSQVTVSYCSTPGQVVMERNQFNSPFGSPLAVANSEVSGISMDGANKNIFNGADAKRAVQVYASSVAEGRSWSVSPDTNAVYVLGGFSVEGDFEAKAGSVIKLPAHHGGLVVAPTGDLKISGTESARVTLTSEHDDSIGGDSMGDKMATVPTEGIYGYAIYFTPAGAETDLEADVAFTDIRYAATAVYSHSVKQASFTDVDISHAEVGLQVTHGDVLFRGKIDASDKGIRACYWGSEDCTVDAAYTDWGNAGGPEACGQVWTDNWIYNGSTNNASLFSTLNCDGSYYDPGEGLGQAQQSFNQALNPYQINCSNGMEDACEVIEMTMQCFAAARDLAISSSTFPIDPDDLAPSTVEFGADLYAESITETRPSLANRFKVGLGILTVINTFTSLSTAYGQCHP